MIHFSNTSKLSTIKNTNIPFYRQMDDATLAENLSKLLNMGFEDSAALNALLKTSNFELAIEYLFNNPTPNFSQPNFSQPNFVIPSKQIPLPSIPNPFFSSNTGQNLYNPVNEGPVPSIESNIGNPVNKFPSLGLAKQEKMISHSLSTIPKTPDMFPVLSNKQHELPKQTSPDSSDILPLKFPKSGLNMQNFQKVPKPTFSSFPSIKPPEHPTQFNSIPMPVFEVPLPPSLENSIESQASNQDNFKDFLRTNLIAKGEIPLDVIEEIVASCLSKEEALLILNIPTYYKDTPYNKIPLNPEKISENLPSSSSEIKKQLLLLGFDEATSDLLALNCSSLEEAYSNLSSNPLIKPEMSNFPKPSISNCPKIFNKIPPPPMFSQGSNYFPPPLNNYGSFSSDSDYGEHFIDPFAPKPFVLNEPSESDPVAPDLKSEYFETLKNYRLTMTEDLTVFNNFSINEMVSPTPLAIKRITNEIKTLSNSLPCDSSASIFMMFDSACTHRLKFLLSGTIDTPYAHGVYLFDVLLPSNYPISPPKVNIITTGGGAARFNPNLYANGYVCLSIINT